MLRAIIIDDEEPAIEALKILISRNSDKVRLVAATLSPEEGITLIEDYKPDVVFLDISMPTMNGFDMLSRLSFRDFALVFTTAHNDFAVKAIKSRAFDYLLKPIDTDDFRVCVEALVRERSQPKAAISESIPQVIGIPVKDGIIYVKQKDIIRLEASRSYTEFHLDGSVRHVASKSLGDFEEKLDPKIFYRCHKSHIINLLKVQKFVNHEGFFARMSDGTQVDISKSSKDIFLERLKAI